MKMKNMKRVVLGAGVGALLLIILIGVGQEKFGLVCSYETNKQESRSGAFIPGGNGERYPDEIYFERTEWCEPLALSLVPFLPILLFSLITYRMHDKVFRAWWNFARWMVPIIIVATLWLNKVDSGSGLGSGIVTIWVLFTLYAILIVTSIWRIVGAYDATKKHK